jgi:hypothetical protein
MGARAVEFTASSYRFRSFQMAATISPLTPSAVKDRTAVFQVILKMKVREAVTSRHTTTGSVRATVFGDATPKVMSTGGMSCMPVAFRLFVGPRLPPGKESR